MTKWTLPEGRKPLTDADMTRRHDLVKLVAELRDNAHRAGKEGAGMHRNAGDAGRVAALYAEAKRELEGGKTDHAELIELLTEELRYWQADSAAAWDKCEKYRLNLAKAMQVLDETRIVLAEYEPHPLPVLAKVLAVLEGGKTDE